MLAPEKFDVDSLYPNLAATEQPARPTSAIARAVAALRHAAPSL